MNPYLHVLLKFYFFLIGCLLMVVGKSQLPNGYTHYSQLNGLPDNNIKAIAQDKYGYIWLGTENGLVRFDGKYFTPFTASKTLSDLPSRDIFNICNLDSNHLGIATKDGLTIIDINRMVSTNLVIPKGPIQYEANANKLRNMLFDKAGNLYLISRSGFYHFNKSKALVFRYDDYTSEESKRGMSFGVFSYWVNDETIIVCGEKRLFLYNTRLKKITPLTTSDKNFVLTRLLLGFKRHQDYYLLPAGKSQFVILNYYSDTLIYVDELKKLVTYSKIDFPVRTRFSWRSELVAVNDSSFLLTGKHNGIYSLHISRKTGAMLLDTNAFFKEKRCNAIFIDRRNKYWLGFEDGLKYQKSSPINLQLHPDAGLNEVKGDRSMVQQLAVTNEHVYAAASLSGGIHQFNKGTLAFEQTIPFAFPPFGNKSMHAIEKWMGDSLVCGSDNGLFLYDEGKNTSRYIDMPGFIPRNHWVADLFLDSKKNIWITTNKSRGCYIWKPGEKKPVWFANDSGTGKNLTGIYHVAEDKDGNIWLAGRGIARYNSIKKLADIFVDKFSETQYQPAAIDAIVIDDNGALWMADAGRGLVLYEPATMKATQFTVNDGLPDETIIGLKYYQGFVWITSKNGIVKINCASKKISAVSNLKDVYYQNFYSSKIVFDSASSSFFTGSGASVIRFEPGKKQSVNPDPNLLMVYAKTGDDSIIWFPHQGIKLSWENRNLTLFYNAINFEDGDFQKYAYRLTENGKTSGWIGQDDQRRLILTGLNPGITIVEIKVFSPQKAWSEKTIRFTVFLVAPFWKTTWFLLLCIGTALFICNWIYRYRVKQTRKIVKIRDDISKDLHDEIGATLSGIAMYSHLVKTNLANRDFEMATQSVGTIQRSATDMVTKLSDIIWLINRKTELLSDMINKLEEYARHMGMAKSMKVEFVLTGPAGSYKPSIETSKNMYLFCKEAINNAVKYSYSDRLVVNFALQDGFLSILIQDYGNGFDPEHVTKGNGHDNMQKRAAELGAECTFQTKPGEGCTVCLRLKITH
ncbi:MAG: two-component regulator propeller domain-containing protein [Bacteroidota bacterium]